MHEASHVDPVVDRETCDGHCNTPTKEGNNTKTDLPNGPSIGSRRVGPLLRATRVIGREDANGGHGGGVVGEAGRLPWRCSYPSSEVFAA